MQVMPDIYKIVRICRRQLPYLFLSTSGKDNVCLLIRQAGYKRSSCLTLPFPVFRFDTVPSISAWYIYLSSILPFVPRVMICDRKIIWSGGAWCT